MFYSEVLEMAVGFIGIIGIIIPSVGFPLAYHYKKKKLEEEHRTNNLALAYQILSQRPEISLEEVKELIALSGGNQIIDSASSEISRRN